MIADVEDAGRNCRRATQQAPTTRPAPAPKFLVADQERHGQYRIHVFDSWQQFRLWCRVNKPKHMVAPSCAHGTRLRSDVDHCGEASPEMLLAQVKDDRRESTNERIETARRLHRLGHNADVDLVALSDAAAAKRKAVKRQIRSLPQFFTWCAEHDVPFDYVENYLGAPLRQWLRQDPARTYDDAARLIIERRDVQTHPDLDEVTA